MQGAVFVLRATDNGWRCEKVAQKEKRKVNESYTEEETKKKWVRCEVFEMWLEGVLFTEAEFKSHSKATNEYEANSATAHEGQRRILVFQERIFFFPFRSKFRDCFSF